MYSQFEVISSGNLTIAIENGPTIFDLPIDHHVIPWFSIGICIHIHQGHRVCGAFPAFHPQRGTTITTASESSEEPERTSAISRDLAQWNGAGMASTYHKYGA